MTDDEEKTDYRVRYMDNGENQLIHNETNRVVLVFDELRHAINYIPDGSSLYIGDTEVTETIGNAQNTQ